MGDRKSLRMAAAEAQSMEGSVCTSEGCDKPGTMACPTCQKYEVRTLFCDQDCFKASWATHKGAHKAMKAAFAAKQASKPIERVGFDGYSYTGPLRAFPMHPTRQVPEEIPRPDYGMHPQGISDSERSQDRKKRDIPVYSLKEQEGIRHAARMGREILDIAGRAVAVGVTCDEIDRVVHEATIERNGYPSPNNYYRFPKSVCTSVNEVICHGIPDGYVLQDGDIVNIDVTIYVNGYHGDLNETFFVGNCDEDTHKLVKCSFECLQAALATVKPGTLYRDVGSVIHTRARQDGCSVVKTYCGHGIGSLFHTAPNVPHYNKNKAVGVMAPGHIFTVEPMINLGTWQDRTWPDDWTSVTVDGKRSAQFEHMVLVTEDGYELLTQRDGEPVMEYSVEKLQR